MHELGFEKLKAVKEETLSALQDEDYLRADGAPYGVYHADCYKEPHHDK